MDGHPRTPLHKLIYRHRPLHLVDSSMEEATVAGIGRVSTLGYWNDMVKSRCIWRKLKPSQIALVPLILQYPSDNLPLSHVPILVVYWFLWDKCSEPAF